MSLDPHPLRPFDLDDLLAASEDGYRYEVIDGNLVVSPAPAWRHQQITLKLARLLEDAAPPEVVVLPAPAWQIGPHQIPEPDVVVAERSSLGDIVVEGTALLVVEVLSPSNRGHDLVRKRALYAEAGCPSYWIVDLDGPTVTVLELAGEGGYAERGRWSGDQPVTVTRPYPVTFLPARL